MEEQLVEGHNFGIIEGARMHGTKVELVREPVFPILLHGAETRTMGKIDRKQINEIELLRWRRVHGLSNEWF